MDPNQFNRFNIFKVHLPKLKYNFINTNQLKKGVYEVFKILLPIFIGFFLINYWQVNDAKKKKDLHMMELIYELQIRKNILNEILSDSMIIYKSGNKEEIENNLYEAILLGTDSMTIALKKFKSYSLKELFLEFSFEKGMKVKDELYNKFQNIDSLTHYNSAVYIQHITKIESYNVYRGDSCMKRSVKTDYERHYYLHPEFKNKVKQIFNDF
jgi:hypothetical protein